MEKLPLSLMCLMLCFLMASPDRAYEGSSSLKTDTYFAEGGGLAPIGSLSKRKVTARKEAKEPLIAENGTKSEQYEDGIMSDTKDLNSTVNLAQIEQNVSQTHESKVLHVDVASNSTHNSSSATVTTKGIIAAADVLGPMYNSSTLPLKKKGKPGVTYDEDDLPKDADGKIILPKENLIGSGPSFDYVVPIVIAMLAVPLVAVVGVFFYKKGRDFWDRRHYRRMDFLIDGMYND